MRLLPCFALIFILCGCSTKPISAYFTPADERLFVQGMEEVNPDGEVPAAFATLQISYPDSPWTEKALKINQLLETLRNQQKTVNRLTREEGACRKDNVELRKKIDSLENDRQKLRQVLIDLEKRGR